MKSNKFLLISIFIILILSFVPFSSQDETYGNLGDLNVDIAYQLSMPFFLEEKFQFGKEIVFTYGPWAIFHTATAPLKWFPLIILFRFSLLSGIILASFCFTEKFNDSILLKRVLLVGLVGFFTLWLSGAVESFYMFPPLAVAYSQFCGTDSRSSKNKILISRNKYVWSFLSFISAWLALTKFSYFVVATLAFSLVLLFNFIKRQFPTLPLIYTITLFIAWLSAGQSLVNLPAWIILSLNLSSGYSDAMSKGFFQPYTFAQVLAYYSSSLIVIILAFYQLILEKSISYLFYFLLTLAIVLISLRYAFGGNQIENSMVLLFVILWFVIVGYFNRYCTVNFSYESRFGFIMSSSASLLIVVILGWLSTGVNFPFFSPLFRLRMIQNNASELVSWIQFKPVDYYALSLTRSHRLWGADIDGYLEKPSLLPNDLTQADSYIKSIDIYPQQTAIIMDRTNLKYDPRPAFLSLNAHTRKLALINAQHLASINSPDLIAFQVLPQEYSVNNRHPATADGPSWPFFLSKYKIMNDCSSGCDFLLLGKQDGDKSKMITRESLLKSSFKLQELIDISEFNDDILYIEISFNRTLFGDFLKMFYKSPHIILRCMTEDEREYSFQIVPELGSAGFIISPLIMNNSEFVQLFDKSQRATNSIKNITFFSEKSYFPAWNLNFEIDLSSLDLSDISHVGDE